MSSCCIKPWDTNKTLEATFEFIYQNQNLPNGNYSTTNVYLNISLNADLNYENPNNRVESFNLIYGKVIDVQETFCKIQSSSLCGDGIQVFTIAYSDISNIISPVLFNYSKEYVAYMNTLQNLCLDFHNSYYELLIKLKRTLSQLQPTDSLYLIYSGTFSQEYSKEDYSIIRNLIYVKNTGIVPITKLSGFFVVENELLESTKLESSSNKAEIERRCI